MPPETAARPAIAASCVGVVKIYWAATGEVHALKGIDALLPAGEVTAIVGPSGSGKSSLLRIVAGLDRPTAGTVTIGDTDLGGLSRRRLRSTRRRLVGYVLQRPSENLLSYLTAAEHLAHAAKVKGVRDLDAEELLDALGIAGRARHYPHQLSGGEQQRLAFAQAIVGDPALVVADEPSAELDSESGRALLGTVRALAARGVGVVMSTHDPEAVKAADQTLYLRHGALQAESKDARYLSVIDAFGRIQLPPEALALFAARRAVLEVHGGDVRITPP